MQDLFSLEQKIEYPESRKYYNEAVRAYHAGAIRSAIISTWIAVSVDIILKIHAIGDQDNSSQAATISKEIRNAIKQNDVPKIQTLERKLLQRAYELELIDETGKMLLERLQDDRHRCAHPAFIDEEYIFSPRAEIARAHLATSVEYLLSTPATGYNPTKLLLRDIDEFTFPTRESITDFTRMRYYSRAKKTKLAGFIEFVVKSAGPHAPGNEHLTNVDQAEACRRYRLVLNALHEIDPNKVNDAIRSVLVKQSANYSQEQLLRTIGALGSFQETWNTLKSGESQKLEAVLQNEIKATYVTSYYIFGNGIHDSSPLYDSYVEAFKAFISDNRTTEASLVLLYKMYTGAPSLLIDATVGLIQATSDYDSAVTTLRLVGHSLSLTSEEDLDNLVDAILNNNFIIDSFALPSMLPLYIKLTSTVPNWKNKWKPVYDAMKRSPKRAMWFPTIHDAFGAIAPLFDADDEQ